MTFALVILVAIALAGLTYLWLERVGTKAWPAIACRAVAWAALGVLLVNLTCALPASSLALPGSPMAFKSVRRKPA